MRKREIVIRLQLPATPRTRWLLAGAAVVLCFGSLAYATVTYFASGASLSSSTMNGYLNGFNDRITTIEGGYVSTSGNQTIAGTKTLSGSLIVSRNGKTYAIGAVYCGNAATTTLPTTGYATMKSQCEAATGCNSSAHMCLGEELVRSAAMGITMPEGWYSDASWGTDVNTRVEDCNGWTTAASTAEGPYWAGYPYAVLCNTTGDPILCCD